MSSLITLAIGKKYCLSRNLFIRRSNLRHQSASISPSTKTTVLLHDIGEKATSERFQACLAGISFRKAEIQPGCSLHVLSEAEANVIAERLKSDFKVKSAIARTSMPSVIFQNIPQDSSIKLLRDAFSQYNPKDAQKLGMPVVQSVFPSAASALKAAKLLSSVVIGGSQLNPRTIRVQDGNFAIQVTDLPHSDNLDKLCDQIAEVLGGVFPGQKVSAIKGSSKGLILRVTPKTGLKSTLDIMEELKVIASSAGGKCQLAVTASTLKKPAIFVRKISHTKPGTVSKLLTEFGATRVQELGFRSELIPSDLAVAYFKSEESALAALKKLKTVTLDGKKITASYKETSEPAFEITNLPHDATTNDVKQILKDNFISATSIKVVNSSPSSKAVVVVGYPKEVDTACGAFRKSVTLRGNIISAAPISLDDIAIDISTVLESEKEWLDLRDSIVAAIKKSDNVAALDETKVVSNVSATLTFSSLHEATNAQAAYTSGTISPFTTGSASKLIAMPSFTVEIDGYSPLEPASTLIDAVASEEGVNVLGCSRSAILKFKKHSDVLPGMTKLRKCTLDGISLKPSRYNPLYPDTDGEYDSNGYDEEWDSFNLKGVLKDFLHADPATRFQVARNYFERALTDAKVDGVELLVGHDAPEKIKAEVETELKKARRNDNPDLERLFNLFIQRQDMQQFTHDFKEMRSLIGKENSSDPFDWSEFRIEQVDDIARLEDSIKRHEQFASLGAGSSIKGGPFQKAVQKANKLEQEELGSFDEVSGSFVNKHKVGKDAGNITDSPEVVKKDDLEDLEHLIDPSTLVPSMEVKVENDETGEEERISLENPDKLIDSDGHVWAGAILDTDMTQKTMPGNRIATHRVLVVVGNLKGAAGFGVGKGKQPQDAINAAFRDALRNLLYVDLYDNFGLAHDLKGKHNSCIAYIRATPRSRIMVASPFAASILNRFGIYSASCKIVGRRNPYSVVRAIFDALEKHENIDETAKARGQRYLTLRWAYDKKI